MGSTPEATSAAKRPASSSGGGDGPPEKRQATEIRSGGSEDKEMVHAICMLTAETEENMIRDLYALTDAEETVSTSDAWWSGRLDPLMVDAARKEEMERLEHFEVYEQIPIEDVTGEIIDTRWVDVPKNGAVRSRIVARQFANEAMAELFAGTPDSTAFRLILHHAASDKERVLLISDAVSAFYQADVTMMQVVKPPKDVMLPGFYWKLKKAMPGLRMASRYWQDHQAMVYVERMGFRRSLIDPCVYVHDEKHIIMESHGDDTLAVGTEASIEWFRDELRKGFECNVQPLVGVSDRLAKEAKFTKRIIRCVPTEGWQFEGDSKHVQSLLQWYGCENAKPAATTGAKAAPTTVDAEPLGSQAHGDYRSTAGLLQYVAGDRFDIKFAVKEITRDAAAPTLESQAKIKKLIRYLVGTPRIVNTFPWQPRQDVLEAVTDADHAGCLRTRKSTSGGVVRIGAHVITDWSLTQPVIALSSGESEFYAIVRGMLMLLFVRNLAAECGITFVRLQLKSDSSAARGMVSRLGVGKKAKHIDTQYLFCQGLVRDKIIEIKAIAGVDNVADLGTKYVDAQTLQRLLKAMGLLALGMGQALTTAAEATPTDAIAYNEAIGHGKLMAALAVGIVTLAAWMLMRQKPRETDKVVVYVKEAKRVTVCFDAGTQTDLPEPETPDESSTGEATEPTRESTARGSGDADPTPVPPVGTAPPTRTAPVIWIAPARGERYHRSAHCTFLRCAKSVKSYTPCMHCA